jgi:winged helix DNA-binding protein
MKKIDIIHDRLINQQIAASTFDRAGRLVSWMCAMQAQEYAMAKWAIGLRVPGSIDAMIEKAFDSGEILRTHLLRPTWHFVAPEDIRWLLELSAPRINAIGAYMYRQLALDNNVFKRSAAVILKSLEQEKYLTRQAIQEALAQKKIVADGLRLGYIMMHAELDGLICSGPRQGKQFTYALLDERVAATPRMSREEALATLAKKYFSSRGPATTVDLATWSGLTITDARRSAASLSRDFIKQTIDGQEYIFLPVTREKIKSDDASFLMPDYDEYGMGYKDRSALQSGTEKNKRKLGLASKYNRYIVINGVIEGTWNRSINKQKLEVQTFPYGELTTAKEKLILKAVKKYKAFAATNA